MTAVIELANRLACAQQRARYSSDTPLPLGIRRGGRFRPAPLLLSGHFCRLLKLLIMCNKTISGVTMGRCWDLRGTN